MRIEVFTNRDRFGRDGTYYPALGHDRSPLRRGSSDPSSPAYDSLAEWMDSADGIFVELGPAVQHVTIDLGAPHEVFAVLFWHFHKSPRVYLDVIVQLADDADFKQNVRTLFNNDTDNTAKLGAGSDMNYVETAEGKLVDAKGSRARYVRLT